MRVQNHHGRADGSQSLPIGVGGQTVSAVQLSEAVNIDGLYVAADGTPAAMADPVATVNAEY